MLIDILLVLSGFLLLAKGADWFVEGAVSLARKLHVSEMTIGLTVVAFGTSTPELFVNIFAAAKGNQDITYGNVLGSNIFNTLVVLGIPALICPLVIRKNTLRRDLPFVFFSGIVLWVFSALSIFGSTGLTVYKGIILIVLLLIFIYLTRGVPTFAKEYSLPLWKTLLYTCGGLGMLIWGGKLVVTHAELLALACGLSQKIIGLTIVAIGTSLPELVTSLAAAKKQKFDIILGNAIGSNIFNQLFIMGTCALITPIKYNQAFNFDFMVYFAALIVLFFLMLFFKKNTIDKKEGLLLTGLYLIYSFTLYYKG